MSLLKGIFIVYYIKEIIGYPADRFNIRYLAGYPAQFHRADLDGYRDRIIDMKLIT